MPGEALPRIYICQRQAHAVSGVVVARADK